MGEVIVLSSDDDDIDALPHVTNGPLKSPEDFKEILSDAADSEVMNEGVSSVSHHRDTPSSSKIKRSGSSGCNDHKVSPWKQFPRSTHALSDSDDESFKVKSPANLSDDELPDIQIPTTDPDLSLLKDNNFYEKTGMTIHKQKLDTNKGTEKQKQRLQDQKERQRHKQELLEKREEKKRDAALTKALKQTYAEVERSKKPPECLKLVTSLLDPGLLNSEYGGEMLSVLRAAQIEYKIEESVIPCSITWERIVETVDVNSDMKVQKRKSIHQEEQMLVVWMWDKFVQLVNDKSLESKVKEIKCLFERSKITIVIYGLEEYFRFQKTQKRRDVRANILGTEAQKLKGKEMTFSTVAHISRGDIELALAELQVAFSICHQIINSKADLANFVCQFTKAVAEAPYKREKTSNADELEWFAQADSQNCVAIDKDGKGLHRLWLQQLCNFNLAGLETSEAIVSVHPSPLSLINAYKKCSSKKEGELLLQDIPVRRGPGPLSSTRRIGPQLSKKIYTFFCSTDGNDVM